ncbi:pilus retraction protein PilT [Neisseria bacilliformis ATCC BAA-1200]|uniref:Pilus retraction protein PilT n=1 Tax=Neisseria bacilliformis ATCC BAA-1200 TaxID=888742 RepID=F2BAC5_9NEIS|nr:pilus retraction protein PilT [Neisseria bacilliformis ATCC BAA-1200]
MHKKDSWRKTPRRGIYYITGCIFKGKNDKAGIFDTECWKTSAKDASSLRQAPVCFAFSHLRPSENLQTGFQTASTCSPPAQPMICCNCPLA